MSVVSLLSDQEALERFKESQPELRSVAQIARLGEEKFVEAYAGGSFFAHDVRQARRVYWTAANLNARNALVWANIKDAVASPYYRATLFNNIPQDFIRHLENLPGYQRLFGNLDFVECDHCRSIFGPAAYFVDLVRFVQDFAGSGTNDQSKAFPINGDDPARRRRPDLFTFPLDCANTHELIPTIDLVNEVLEAVIRSPEQPDAMRVLDETSFPWAVPFSRPLAEIREYLSQLGTSLSTVYDAYLRRQPAGSEAAATRHIDREYLNLSPNEYALLATEATKPEDIAALYGGSRYDLDALSSLPTFLEQTGLDRKQVNELIYQDLDRHEFSAGLSRLFFINNVDDGLGPLLLEDGPNGPGGFDERLVNLSYAKLDRIHRFVRLARTLGWSFTDLDMALRSLAEPYEPQPVLRLDGVSDYVACRNVTGLDLADFTVEAWVNPSRHGANVIVAKGHEPDWHFVFLINPDGKLAFYDQKSQQFISGMSQVPTGVWSHVAVTVSGTDLRFYLDGQPDGPFDEKGNEKKLGKVVSPLGADLDIGRNLIDAYFAGQITEVRIWQGAASQAAIAGGRYRRLTGREPGLAGYWPLTENPYNQLFDLTPNRNDGVMGGREFIPQPVWVQRDLVLEPAPEPVSAKAYHFNGVDQYLAARAVRGSDMSALTLEAWVKWEQQTPAEDQEIIAKGQEDTDDPAQFRLWIDGSGRLAFYSTSLAKRKFTSKQALAPGQWTHIAVTLPESLLDGPLYRGFSDSTVIDNFRKRALDRFDDKLRDKVIEAIKEELKKAPQDGQQRSGIKGVSAADFLDALAVAIGAEVLATPTSAATETPIAFIQKVFKGSRGVALSQDTMDALVSPSVPVYVYERLEQLRDERGGQPFTKREDFVDALRRAIGTDILAPYQAELLQAAEVRCLRITIDGKPEEFEIGQGAVTLAEIDAKAGDTIVVGRKLTEQPSYRYFQGWLKELRVWRVVRTAQQLALGSVRAVGSREPGLAGYWRFDDVKDGTAQDLSSLGNDLFLGGILADYAPERVATDYYLPPLPVAVGGKALAFDGQNTLVEVQDPKNRSLGAYDRTTLALWFNAADAAATDREQILYTQGDAEDGLAIYLHGGVLTVAAWANSFEGDALQTLVLKTAAGQIGSGMWQHVAVVKDEEADPDAINTVPQKLVRYTAYLDGSSFGQADATFRLSPVGPSFLGGLGKDAVTWSETLGTHSSTLAGQTAGPMVPHFFAGMLADLRVWRTPKTEAELAVERFVAPVLPDPDLILYLPLTETTGPTLEDRSGNNVVATFLARNMVLAAQQVPAELDEVHAHYADPAALQWTNYAYTGRLRVSAADGAVGLTFFSRYPEQIDRYYAIKRDKGQATFVLASHPAAVQTLQGATDSHVTPQANDWHRFRIEVEAQADRTAIRAKIWPETAPEPADFQIDAFDASSVRAQAGTVGIWTQGDGQAAFDQIEVRPLAGGSALLVEHFERLADGQAPPTWQQTGTRRYHQGSNTFRTIAVDGNTTYGTDLPEDGNLSLVNKRGAQGWTDYTVRGDLLVTEDDSGVGVLFLAQGPDRYYKLGRNKEARSFSLTAWPAGLHTLDGNADTGVVPAANSWVSFKIKTETTAGATRIQAKVWPSDDDEPLAYQVDVSDASDVRLGAGTIGVWASGPGIKCVDSLIVSTIERQGGKQLYSVLHSESFRSVRRGRQPAGWQDSGAVDRFQSLTDAFTGSEAQAGAPQWHGAAPVADYPLLLRPLNRKALKFDGSLTYAAAEKVTSLDATQFTIEAWIKPTVVRAGPILSQQAEPGAATSLQLGLNAQGQLALSYARKDSALETVAGATPVNAAEWSHVAATVDGSRVLLYVNGQQDGAASTAEPVTLGGACLELGRGVDLAAGAPAVQIFAGQIRDLRIWRAALRAAQLAEGRFQQPELSDELIGYWPFDETTGDSTADQSPANLNALRLGGLESARRPVLHDPSPVFAMPALADPALDAGLFDPAALKLDGVDDYVDIALAPAVTADAATWEAWVRLDNLAGEATLWEQTDQRVRLAWRGNRLAVFVAGNETQTFDFGFDGHAWTHVAVVYSSADKRVDLYVNGSPAGQSNYGSAAALVLSDARIGLNHAGAASLRGMVKELRLWSAARSETDIRATMFRRLSGAEPNLLVYRPFDEQASLEHAPSWVSPDLLADSLGQGFWRGQRLAVSFDGTDEMGLVRWVDATEAPATGAAPCQRRTVEVWFRADDVRISRRKQVIYHEGDDRQGLALYLFDGRLYYGGYSRLADPKAFASWAGTWLSTERVSSGRWHHAAIVLDGRDEVRDGSFQAYLDGKLVDDGLGAQLATCSRSIALGRAGGRILFHDGEVVDAPTPAPVPAPKPAPVLPKLTPADLDKSTIPLGQPQQPFPFPSQAFTVECWINPNVSRYQGSPISYAVDRDNDNTFVLYLYHHSELTVVINEQRISASGVTTLAPNRWQHVAVTWQASDGQIDVYKDGQAVFSGKVSAGQPVAGGGSLVFGQEQDRPGGDFDPDEVFHGKLNEVRIWDHVRTAEQVLDGMNQRLPDSESGLVARWPADPTAGSSQAGDAASAPAAAAGNVGGGQPGGQDAANDVKPLETAHFLGQILDLRIWNTARTQRQLDVYRYRQLRDTDAAAALDLWWQFEDVVNGVIPDLSGKGHAGALTPPAKIRPIDAAPALVMPRSRLDEDGLGRLANLKRLMARYNLPMDRLTALWHEIRHTGREDGRTLWDDTFNPSGSELTPWPFHIDQPLRGDMSGATDQELSRQIRSRLMGALRVSHEQLNLLVATLSGEGETIVELDGPYLTNLYRLARLPGLLRLSVAEFQRLLALMQLDKVASLPALVDVSERVDWMQRTGIDVFELDFLSNDRESARVAFPYNDGAIRDLADSLRRQSGEILARANSFVTAEVGELASVGLFKLMQPSGLGIVDDKGAVRPDYEPPDQFDKLFYLAPVGDAGDATKLELNLTQAAYARLTLDAADRQAQDRLTQKRLDQLRSSGLIGDSGLVLDKGQVLLPPAKGDFSDTRLKQIFPAVKSDDLALIREALERALKIQSDLAAKLLQLRDGLNAATLAGLSVLVAATPDRTLAVLPHLDQPAIAAGTATPAPSLSEQEQSAQRQLASRRVLKDLFKILVTDTDDQSPIPASLTARPGGPLPRGGYLYRLSKILFLAGQFGLTVDEISALVEEPARFSVAHLLRPELDDLLSLYRFASLKMAFGDTEGNLVGLLNTNSNDSAAVAAAIHRLTGWEQRQIRSLMRTFGSELEYNRVAGLERLHAMFELADTLHVDVDFFTTQLAQTADLSYAVYARLAANLLEIVRSHYDDEQWTRVSRPIHDRLAVQTRDALLGRAMLAISPEFAGRRSPDVLSEYLLLDVQTGSEVDTSRLVQATAALQLYVQRCMMNLERGIDPASIPADQWQWMKNYRVWEANRKVFLYPENYIEPELRDTKTPFFEELEQDLLQGEINQDLVKKAYVRYLDKFAEVANLKIVGSYLHVEPADEKAGMKSDKPGKQVLYLVGCTRTDPKVLYLRQQIDGTQWTPWQKVSVSISTDFVTPVYAFKRLFLFWPEFVKSTEARPIKAKGNEPKNDEGNRTLQGVEMTENYDVYQASIRYTYQNFAGEWVLPQTYLKLGRDLEKYEIIRPEWQRVYAQRSDKIALDNFFSIEDSYVPDLDGARLSDNLREEMKSHRVYLPADGSVTLTVLQSGRQWRIDDKSAKQTYNVVKEHPDSEMLNVYPTNEWTEDKPQVLQVSKGHPLSEQIPKMSMVDLTWEFWVHLSRKGSKQSVEAIPKQVITLLEYGPALLGIGDPHLRFAVSNNVTKIHGAPDIPALQKTLATNEQAALDAKSEAERKQQALDKLNATMPKDNDAINKATVERDNANEDLNKANDRVKTARKAVDEAKTKPQFESLDLTFAVQFRGESRSPNPLTVNLDYDMWQHLAIAMRYNVATRQYEVTLIKSLANDAKSPETIKETSPSGDVLPEGKKLAIGIQDFSDKDATYTIQMSEFRLWDSPRDIETIKRETSERRRQDNVDSSPFVLPLNTRKGGIKLVEAASPLTLRIFVDPTTPVQRERILLFWGKEVQRSIRDTLQDDQEYTLALRKMDLVPPSYSVDLIGSALSAQAGTQFSINDYAAGRQATLSRFSPGIRLLLTSAFNASFKLNSSQVAQIRPLLGSLSAFAKVDDETLSKPDRLEDFVKRDLQIDPRTVSGSHQNLLTDGSDPQNRMTDADLALAKVTSVEASFADVGNQPGWYVLDTSDEQLLVRVTPKDKKTRLRTAADRLRFYYAEDGWRGEYFNNIDLLGAPALVRTDINIDFSWGSQSPADGVKADGFSVRWTRDQHFNAGTYRFTATFDDGVRLYVDDDLVINRWEDGASRSESLEKQLGHGWHSLRFEFYEKGGFAEARLKWEKRQPDGTWSPTPPASAAELLKMYFEPDDALNTTDHGLSAFEFHFDRLSTFVVHQLSLRLFADGIDGLLSLATQALSEKDFDKTYQPTKALQVVPPRFDRATGAVPTGIDFDGAHGMYYREIFFHIPFFIANQLNTNQNFAEAQKWYHYIFNPTVVEDKPAVANAKPAVAEAKKADAAANPNDRYWQFRPFRKLSLESLRQMLSNQEALEEYRQDPFDPHAIARLRINAYQKAIVMKYIDNLLDWGDNLFSQDTRESINEAAQLYVLAYNLLGPRPKSKAVKELRPIGTLEDVLARQADLPDFVVELDRRRAAPALDGPAAITPNNAIVTDFCVVENEQFMGYWDRVEDRLYKIRHSLNIEGIFRQLALFQPPINPMDLVRAVAGGRDLGSVLSDLNVPVPHYRFTYMWERAKDIVGTVSGLGSALLDAIEKRDAEALAALENSHERQILDLTTKIKEQEQEVAENALEALAISKNSIQARRDHYDALIRNGLLPREIASAVFLALKGGAKTAEGIAKFVGELTEITPNAETGAKGIGGSPVFTIEIGGKQIGAGPKAIGEASAAAAEIFGIFSEAAATGAEYERREQEWEHEKTIADHELGEIEKQIAIAKLQLAIAKHELAIHRRTMAHNQEIADFHRSKFGNQALYNWMVSRLSGLYFQAYKLAYDYAKSAEKALQFELPTTQSYISFGHWDSLKKGLLAGESLQLELDRMEKSHLNQDSRFQEIEKQISMQRSLSEALETLKSGGTADFQLSEKLFNQDFPGHYARMIKTIGISIKTTSEVSPYDSLYATLIQLGNRTLLEPNIDAVRYLMGVDGADQPDAGVLRTNWRANQQVVISKIDDEEGDDGMFALDFFFDNRYFPFEGTGAVSAWRLEISKAPEGFDLSSITDVVIHLRYTAKYDSGAFKQAVIKAMSNP